VVTGNNRDSSESVLGHLELRTGQPFDSQLPSRLQKRLEATGRFVANDVRHAQRGERTTQERAIVDLTINVREYEPAPPLADALFDEEQAALKLGDWAERWSRGQEKEDVVIEASRGSRFAAHFGCEERDDEDAGVRLTMRVVASPHGGASLVFCAAAADDQPILEEIVAACPGRILLGSPLRQAKLELPHVRHNQCELSFITKAADPAKVALGGGEFVYSYGLRVRRNGQRNASPFKVKLELLPAALLAMAYGHQTRSTLKDGRLEIHSPNYRARLDAASGRPLEIVWDDRAADLRITITTVVGALTAEQRRIEKRLAGATSAYDSTHPFRSTIFFVLDEWVFALDRWAKTEGNETMRKQLAGWQAVHKLIGRWQPPLPDSWPKQEQERLDQLKHPREVGNIDLENLLASDPASRRNLAGMLLHVHREIAPKSGWLWPVGRDGILALGGETRIAEESLQTLVNSPDVGPLGELVLASLGAEDAALTGLGRISAAAFRRDYQPLLAGDSWVSKWLLSLAEAARSLDERELRDLAGLIEDNNLHETLCAALIQLKSQPNDPVAQSLAAVLDQLWQRGLREQVQAALMAYWLAARETAHAPRREFNPRAGEVHSGLADPLQRLQELEDQIKEGSANPLKDDGALRSAEGSGRNP
jgi:hypothetical protein